ncbi:sensor domain-containing diguanylate cyclase [Alteromonas sp. a30]|uniref:sensor domain-containing diguanylate cyclase n=1 Tax=Alteromonas sp. a30 TaxID=2730917 RepID=UPI0022801067|nr:EAL domain-containing protein [Alteromonas sp. a30]MCY7294939.1 EAL domain-containing protein [Alteromonas sp. a30]
MVTQTPAEVLSEAELRELVPELQQIADKYKRKELVQTALFQISELSSSVSELTRLYAALHKIIDGLMNARNFYVAYYDDVAEEVDFVYFVDEFDELNVKQIPAAELKNGMTGYVLRTGNPLFATKENFDEIANQLDIRDLGTSSVDWLGVPLKRGSKVIGAMVVQSYDDSVRHNEEDMEVLQFVSQHIVTSIDRVKNREFTERTIRERTKQLRKINDELQEEIQERQKIEDLQQALFEISELSAGLDGDMENFYSNLHIVLARLIHAPNCYIAIHNKDENYLEFPYFSDESYAQVAPRPLGWGLTEYVLRHGRAELIGPNRAKELADEGELDIEVAHRMKQGQNYWLGTPLVVEGVVSGVVGIQSYNDKYKYQPKDLELLRYVSHHIAVALERKHASEEIQAYNQQLTDKVKERTEELHRANASLKEQIEERKQIELRLIHDAHHDSLTGLPNRALFTSRVELAIANKMRYPKNKFAILFIDLDRFKLINDTLGHQAGDQFLIEVSQRISRCIRGHDLLARLGGDEFVILLDSFERDEDAEEVAVRILDTMSNAFSLEGTEMYSGGSIGIAFIETWYKEAGEVIRDADAAMYQAKSSGRGRYVMFDQSMRKRLLEEVELENEFRHTLKDNNFDCYSQPIIDLNSKEELYCECYVRWHHSKLGKIKRERFWNVAEHVGMTLEIDRFMIEQACQRLREWQETGNEQERKRNIGINISVSHLMHSKQVKQLIKLIQNSGVPPEKLVLEIDESHINGPIQHIHSSIQELKDLGVTLVLDNFGNGMASLNSLCHFPFDFVKVDRHLIKSLPENEQNRQLVHSLQQIANNFGFRLIANGIEAPAQLSAVQQIGCLFAQGRHISQPVPLLPAQKSQTSDTLQSPSTNVSC